jgi:UV DNA damage endonuclease
MEFQRPKTVLGYCCINMTLSNVKPIKNRVTTNRTCIRRTFLARGLDYISELMLKNVIDLEKIVEWNYQNKIYLYRISSSIFPWVTEYQFHELKDYQEIKAQCKKVGDLATKYHQRLTMHPNHFVVLASPKPEVVKKSLRELEAHSELFDMMGYVPSLENKINIHIAATYGDKASAIIRFKDNFKLLSENCRKRMAIENDDTPKDYSIDDILPIAKELNCAVTYDLMHQRFCFGKMTAEEAFLAAIKTWGDVRPVIHFSESQQDGSRKPNAHSDYVYGPLNLYGHESKVDVMIEAKMKELALLRFRELATKDILT